MPRAFLLVPFSACLFSCESKESRQNREYVQRNTDSLAATGQHGYFVATYLKGRYKTSRLERPHFQLEVGRMDERLLQSAIGLQLLDTLGYQLTYTLHNDQKTFKGDYNAVVLGKDMTLRLALDSFGRFALPELVAMDYELRVYAY